MSESAAASVARTIVASAAAGAAAWLLLDRLGGYDLARYGRTVMRAVQVFVPLGGAIVVYVAAAWVMRMEEVRLLLSRHKREVTRG